MLKNCLQSFSLFLLIITLIITISSHPLRGEDKMVYGTLQSEPARAQTNFDAGIRIAVLGVSWDRYEPQAGRFDEKYIADVLKKRDAFKAVGMMLMVDFGMQYPPAWVGELPHGRFVNQYGDPYTDLGNPGSKVVNGVFNQTVRDHQAAYVKKVLSDLGDVDFIRLGWGYYGEFGYPQPKFKDNENCYWAYDDLAQGRPTDRASLPPTLSPCPVPGWKPGEASPDHHAASQFINWYLDSLRDYHDWQIRTVRSMSDAKLCLLYPSWGVRPGQLEAAVMTDLSNTTPPERNGEPQRGHDFARFINGITDRDTIIYTTWLDPNPEFSDENSPSPTRWSPVHFLADLAGRHPLKLPVMGENTGPGTKEALALSLQRAGAYKLAGIVWAFEGDLYDGKNADLVMIDEFRDATSRKR